MTNANENTLGDAPSHALDQLQRASAPVIEQGKRRARVLLDQSGNLLESASNRAAEIGDSVLAYTKQNPLAALLFAVGAGALLIGLFQGLQSRR